MAAIVYFNRLSETAAEARYAFGFDAEALTRTLVVDKAADRSVPEDGQADAEFRMAATKIHSVARERGSWPERGSFVS